MKRQGDPISCMDEVISTWINWGPDVKRGTKDVATLEELQQAINSANLSRVILTLD